METTSDTNSASFPEVQEKIRRRAEEIYIQSGRVPGRDVENWTQAEREILVEAEKPKGQTAIVVKINGVRYVCEYQPESSEGYLPGEFPVGSSVSVRLHGDKIFVKRPNGRELETRVVRKSR
jgi:Protein of unknown function (DUF2934)